MKNRLSIKNFIIFKDIELEINHYNVFIGPQASGKSLVAKMLFLFFHLPSFYFKAIVQNKDIDFLKKDIIGTFSQIFPKEIWQNQAFDIKLETSIGYLSFNHNKSESILFSLSEEYIKLFITLNAFFDSIKTNIDYTDTTKVNQTLDSLRSVFHEQEWGFVNNGGDCTFIPAGRSFFAALQENVFTLLSNNVDLDYFIKNFGANYENAKKFHQYFLKYETIQKDLLKGIYNYNNKKDYIHTVNPNIDFNIQIRDASSGQQEVLPMLNTLFSVKNTFFMIEEPETHIFPDSQYALIKFIFARRENIDRETAFLITTHSPYILTTVNNLAYAGFLEEKFNCNAEKLEQLNNIFPINERIPSGELSAYLFKGEIVKSIIDEETHLIFSEEIDSISNIIEDDFSKLILLDNEGD